MQISTYNYVLFMVLKILHEYDFPFIIFCIFAIGRRNPSKTFEIILRRYVFILYMRSLRNFINGNKRWRNGLHAMRGAVIPTSFSIGFLRACI